MEDIFKIVNGVPELLGSECTLCDYRWFPAAEFGCERCGAHGDNLVERLLSANGILLSCVKVPEGEIGFILASIKLDEGPVLRGIIESDETVAIGDKVEAFETEADGEKVIRFRKRND